jgi:hypothetical protein
MLFLQFAQDSDRVETGRVAKYPAPSLSQTSANGYGHFAGCVHRLLRSQ